MKAELSEKLKQLIAETEERKYEQFDIDGYGYRYFSNLNDLLPMNRVAKPINQISDPISLSASGLYDRAKLVLLLILIIWAFKFYCSL